jgi:hypothetical protein
MYFWEKGIHSTWDGIKIEPGWFSFFNS